MAWLSARRPAAFHHISEQRYIYDLKPAEPDLFHQFWLTWRGLASPVHGHWPKWYNFTEVWWQVKMWNWLRPRESDIFVECNHFYEHEHRLEPAGRSCTEGLQDASFCRHFCVKLISFLTNSQLDFELTLNVYSVSGLGFGEGVGSGK